MERMPAPPATRAEVAHARLLLIGSELAELVVLAADAALLYDGTSDWTPELESDLRIAESELAFARRALRRLAGRG
jgi:hypothetical protein